MLMAYAGDWERGCALIRQSDATQPPSSRLVLDWYLGMQRLPPEQTTARPWTWRSQAQRAPELLHACACWPRRYAQLGEREAARKALRDLLALKPDFAAIARELLGHGSTRIWSST